MRQQQHLCAAAREFEDGRLDRLDPHHIGGRAVLHGKVEIDPHQRDFAGEVGGQIIKGLELGHLVSPSFRRRPEPSSSAGACQLWAPACAGVTNGDYRNFAITPAVSIIRLEKPHSLSYQLTTRASLPSMTEVSRLSTVDDAG